MPINDQEKQHKYYMERSQKRRLLGLCVCCGAREAIKGRVYCPDCRDAQRYSEAVRIERRKAAGICIVCGSRPAAPGKTRCEECSRKNNQRIRGTIERRRAAGVCIGCGRKLSTDSLYKNCPICREKQRQYRRRYKEQQRERTVKPDG